MADADADDNGEHVRKRMQLPIPRIGWQSPRFEQILPVWPKTKVHDGGHILSGIKDLKGFKDVREEVRDKLVNRPSGSGAGWLRLGNEYSGSLWFHAAQGNEMALYCKCA